MRKLGFLIATIVMLSGLGAQGALAEEGVPLKPLAAGTVFNIVGSDGGPRKITITKMDGVSIQQTSQGRSTTSNENIGFGVGLIAERSERMSEASRAEVAKLFPLKVGNKVRMEHTGNANGPYTVMDKMEVTEAKKITVSAGTFDTFVIETSMHDTKFPWRGDLTCWYAPEVGYCVKREWRSSRNNDDWELVSVVLP